MRAVFDDGTAASGVPVTWDSVAPEAYADAEAMFDVAGTVAGSSTGALATVFVIAPMAQTTPLVSIAFDAAPEGSGWYVTSPKAVVTTQKTAADMASTEISLDGGATWNPYTEPVTVEGQGEVTVRARATAVDGAVGEARASAKVDTVAPVTEDRIEVVDGDSALVTLSPTDAEPGSGLSRTVWSDGPDADPAGASNNMFATYEKPFSVELTDAPRYVHVRSQDTAGNEETTRTITLPPRTTTPVLEIESSAVTRMIAGKAYVIATVKNTDDVAVDVVFTSAYGSKTVTGVQPGKSVSASFSSRAATVPAGQVLIKAAAVVGGQEVSVERTADYGAL